MFIFKIILIVWKTTLESGFFVSKTRVAEITKDSNTEIFISFNVSADCIKRKTEFQSTD